MSKAGWGIVVVVSVCGVLSAAEFWEGKKFSEWNEKEVRQLMMNSPWARKVDVPVGSPAVGRGRGGGRGGGRASRGGGGDFGGGGMVSAESSGVRGGATSIEGGAGEGSDGFSVQTVPVFVRWQTALPIKQAMARFRWGSEAATSAEAAKLLTRQEAYYIVLISGIPGRMLGEVGTEKLKSSSFLKLGRADPIAAVNVQVNRATPPLADIYLAFPRSQPGARAITLEDKEVEVTSRIGSFAVRRKFRLKEMVFQGKLEL